MRPEVLRMNPILCLAFGIAMLAVHGRPAYSDSGTLKAKQLYDDGVTNYNLGHYDEALEAFENGYRIRHDPAFLFNIAQCQRQLHRYEDAERSYRAYLRESPDLPEATRQQVQKLMAEMQQLANERAKAATSTGVPTSPPSVPAPASPPRPAA